MLSKQAIEEFQAIHSTTYGEKLSFAKATDQAARLIRLYKAVLEYPPSTKKQEETNHDHKNL